MRKVAGGKVTVEALIVKAPGVVVDRTNKLAIPPLAVELAGLTT
jgi:hypothetical protein